MSTNYLTDEEIEIVKINQAIITRMSENSKHIKTVFLTLATIMGTIMTNDDLKLNLLLVLSIFIGLTIICWYLDAKYLQLERMFRKHHSYIISKDKDGKKMWSLNPMEYKAQVDSVCKIMFSFSLSLYSAPITIIIFVSAVLFICKYAKCAIL